MSPFSRLFMYFTYWTCIGSFKPYLSAIRSRICGGTFRSSDGLKGPPGIACIRKNVMVTSTNMEMTPAPRRFKMYLNIRIDHCLSVGL